MPKKPHTYTIVPNPTLAATKEELTERLEFYRAELGDAQKNAQVIQSRIDFTLEVILATRRQLYALECTDNGVDKPTQGD